MITIEELLVCEEGQTFDRKSIQIKPKDLAVAMVAMANADGGDLVVGISDTKREVEGVDGNEIKLNDIRRTPFDFCVPSVNAITELVPCFDRNGQHNHVLVFHVEPGLRVYANQADEVFLRVGDKSKKLSFDERFQLLNDKGQACYEETCVQAAKIGDIDMDLVEDYCKVIGYGKVSMDFLQENHGYLIEKNGEFHPTVVAHFSRNPRIARYLKAYTYVKEFGEGVGRMCREMEADGLLPIKYYKSDFILKAVAWSKNAKLLQVGKSNDNHPKSSDKVAISGDKVAISWADIRDNCNKNTIIILEYLMSHYSITNVIAREITGLSSSGVRKIFSNLVTNKIVKAQGGNRDKSYTLIMHFIDR